MLGVAGERSVEFKGGVRETGTGLEHVAGKSGIGQHPSVRVEPTSDDDNLSRVDPLSQLRVSEHDCTGVAVDVREIEYLGGESGCHGDRGLLGAGRGCFGGC